MLSAAPEKIFPDKNIPDKNFVSIEKATSVATMYAGQISSTIPEYSDWNGATVQKATTYFDLKGKESAYSFDVMVNGKYAGYLMVSAIWDNYPVLEFSKGVTPDKEISTKRSAEALASNVVGLRQASVGTGRPLYLGATFYYMEYPVVTAKSSVSAQKSGQDKVLVDLSENKIVTLDDTNNDKTLENTDQVKNGMAQSGWKIDVNEIQKFQQQKKQEASAEWANLEKRTAGTDSSKTVITSSVSASSGPEKLIEHVPNYKWLHGCTPTSAAMVLGYWRDLGLTKIPADTDPISGEPLNHELADELGTCDNDPQHDSWVCTWLPWLFPVGATNPDEIQSGMQNEMNKYNYPYTVLSSISTAYSWPEIQNELNSDRPFVISMMWGGAPEENPTVPYKMHSVAAVGYDYVSWGSQKYIKIYDTSRSDNERRIRFGNWFAAMNTFVRPDYTYTITASAGPNGQIYPVGAVQVPRGTNKTFNITPESGYVIDQILVDNNPVTEHPYLFSDVKSDHIISATFKPAATNENQLLTHGFIEELSGAGKVVTLNTTAFYWDGTGHVYLTGGNGYMNTAADDVFDVDTDTGSLTFAGPYLQIYQGIPDITPICHVGENTLTLKVRDLYSVRFGCPETWLYFDNGLNKTFIPTTLSLLDPDTGEVIILDNSTYITGMKKNGILQIMPDETE
jgi:hypothetical protein